MDTPQRQAKASGPGPWLRRLCDLALEWARKAGEWGAEENETSAYIDLIFSFGLAREGERDASRELLRRAQAMLVPGDEAHRFLLAVFEYRICQAVEGKPHTGALPAELTARLPSFSGSNDERMRRFVIDRLRMLSRVLEPVHKVDPYARYTARSSVLDRALADLADLTDQHKLADGVQQLLREAPKDSKGNVHRLRVLKVGLDLAPRISEEFARELLGVLLVSYDALPQPQNPAYLFDRAMLLEKGLAAATHFDQTEWIHPLMDRVKQLLRMPLPSVSKYEAFGSLIRLCLRALRTLGLHDQIDGLLVQVIDCLGINSLEFDRLPKAPVELRALLPVAGGWFSSGRERQAEPILEVVRGLLFTSFANPITRPKDLKDILPLICNFAEAVCQAPAEVMQRRLEELFARLPGIGDSWTTHKWYCVSQLQVIEAVVWAVLDHEEPPLVIDNR
jgi:hypothetical protein